MQRDEPLRRFITGMPKERFAPALGPATLAGVYVETDAKGAATRIEMVRQGGALQACGHEPVRHPVLFGLAGVLGAAWA